MVDRGTPPAPHAPFAFLGLACGVGVASLYLCQPLLPQIAHTFGSSAAAAGLVSVATQAGYVFGLLGFVPLGDIVERRALMVRLYSAAGVALLLVAMAPTLPLLLAASVLAGAVAAVTHVVLPIAPDLASPAERGRAIGVVMTGLLLGILLARTLAGGVNDLAEHLTHRIAGWRVVFLLWALVSASFAPAMQRVMPRLPGKQPMPYRQAIRSLWTLFRAEPLLRESCLMGALVFGAFAVFWNTLAFVLAKHGLGAGVTGTFGLVGAAGALMASRAGRLADRQGSRYVLSLALGIMLLALLLIFSTERLAFRAQSTGHLFVLPYLAALAFGVVLLDIGAQSSQLANQTRIFALQPDARSRINTIYMVCYFTGSTLASASSTLAWQRFGIFGVSGLAILLVLLAVLRHVTGLRIPHAPAEHEPEVAVFAEM